MGKYFEQDSNKHQKKNGRLKGHVSDSHSPVELLSRSIIDSLPIGIIAFDSDLMIIQSNPEAAQMIELSDSLDKSLAKGTDAKIWQDWRHTINAALSMGESCKFDQVEYTRDGVTKLLNITCATLAKENKSSNLCGLMVIEDITEKANLQSQLANAERLVTVGKVASKVAHELNNPLDGILRYINLTLRVIEKEDLEKPKEYLTQCREGLLKMVQIVSELLEFSRSTYISLDYAPIEQIIEDTLKTMRSRAEALNVQILRNYLPGLPNIRTSNLFQVFSNLAKNALDAMPQGGKLIISTSLQENNTIVIEFRDTGAGLPSEHIEDIFKPFFTTKPRSIGTGLGLAICRDIVESYNGRITGEIAPEGGSIFTVYLPITSNL